MWLRSSKNKPDVMCQDGVAYTSFFANIRLTEYNVSTNDVESCYS